jgi:hypothetical protein
VWVLVIPRGIFIGPFNYDEPSGYLNISFGFIVGKRGKDKVG